MKIGVIGGSGLYDLAYITDVQEIVIDTPFGPTSDKIVTGNLHGKEVLFIPRHGKGHVLLPSEIPFRANIWALKSLGVTHLISVTAVGSLKEEVAPGDILLPDQFIDRTTNRVSTFFGNGVVAHNQFGDPICGDLLSEVYNAAQSVSAKIHKGGTYVCMEGPLFSTRAESEMYRSFGASVIGMTNIQEAKLAREAELCFATISLVTDYDCWHKSEEEVTIEAILEVMGKNIQTAKDIVSNTVKDLKPQRNCGHDSALNNCIITQRDLIPEKTKKDLDIIIGKYI